MRTAIILSGMIIADALNYIPSSFVGKFIGIMFMIYLLMDIVEFSRGNEK